MNIAIEKILNKSELSIVKKLSSPKKIQDFIDTLPYNFELRGETYMSPQRTLRERKAHCFEGALLAHLVLSYHGYTNFIIDLKVKQSAIDDQDHIICTFKQNGYWGAISKTNHSVLRWRDPIHKSCGEVARTYFHEYFLSSGEKTLKSFSKPINLFKKFGVGWVTEEKDLDSVATYIDKSPHLDFVPKINAKKVRKVGKTEINGAKVVEWQKSGKRL